MNDTESGSFGANFTSATQSVTIGDDLYGVSVAELKTRIEILREEIVRTEAALTKKASELSEAETLFMPKAKKEN